MKHFDVLIIGAGLSGIGAACQLKLNCPNKSFAILEGRSAMGGTWDLFRYLGIRSDSDMYTLGYRFRPWQDAKAIADGPAILNYIRETALEFGIDKQIYYNHQVKRACWSSKQAHWVVESEVGQEKQLSQFTCNFLYLCTGYYDYEKGYTPEWPGVEHFQGHVIHPQKWPENLDYTGKRVVVIGSGATAVTLVPAMAQQAAHVVMLQRSPSYIATLPSEDKVANLLRKYLPTHTAYMLTRWKNVLLGMFFYNLARKQPEFMKRMLSKRIHHYLGEDYARKHFTPNYNPWDQRLCLVPNGDLFKAIRSGKASVITDHIESFTETGLKLKSGEKLDADIIVTATGLVMKLLSGLELVVDGTTVDLSKTISYKGMMYSDVPNAVSAIGYTNASWTLKCDLIAEYICRILNHMDSHNYVQCTPRVKDPSIQTEPIIDFSSGYVQRALHTLPKQGSKTPWRLHQNYIRDLSMLRYGSVEDGSIEFKRLQDNI